MRFAFHKMHGLGNDFVVIDARRQPLALTQSSARAIAERRTGIGCDQLIMLEPDELSDAHMRIWNADGGEVAACGNATRAVGLLLGGTGRLRTAGGTVTYANGDGGGIRVDMGVPRLGWDEVPLAYPLDTAALPLAWEELREPAALSMGNPHLVFFVPDIAAVDLARLGPLIEHDPLFPERINVNAAQVTGQQALTMRTWERGAGLTRACGTGACATAVAALRRRLVQSPVAVTMPGGQLLIEWTGDTVRMTGPATHVFSGEAELEQFA